MKKVIIILSIVAAILAIVCAAVWLLPYNNNGNGDYSYGVSEGLQLVRKADGSLVVEDSTGNTAFVIPLRGCIIDTRYRNGILRFHEKATGREGYIDMHGYVNFTTPNSNYGIQTSRITIPEDSNHKVQNSMLKAQSNNNAQSSNLKVQSSNNKAQCSMLNAQSSMLKAQSKQVLQANIAENDAKRRKVILNYCEHFRAAYTTKDIDFIRQVFSDKALIIVGNVVKAKGASNISGDSRVTYATHTKADYLARLEKVFKANKAIDVRFSNFKIMRHPTMDGIYGVTLRQHYKSDRYEDDGWLFLLWDFRNPSMPIIHVRTWQPAKTVSDKDDVINISDFNLE